jgi:hypothetical protein
MPGVPSGHPPTDVPKDLDELQLKTNVNMFTRNGSIVAPLVTSNYKITYFYLWPLKREPCSMEEQRNSYAREA